MVLEIIDVCPPTGLLVHFQFVHKLKCQKFEKISKYLGSGGKRVYQ